MIYQIDFTNKAKGDIQAHIKSGNTAVIKKISVLIKEIVQQPFEGTGKPEALKHSLTGLWSRRINLEHRLIYEVSEEFIIVHSAKGHYN
jgi:toxin YoeB